MLAVHYPDYKPTLESPPLSDPDLDELDRLLSGLGVDEAMNIEMLDGYLTALLLAPTPVAQVSAGQWLPAVWGGDGEGDKPFSSGKQKKRVIGLVLRHLRAIDQAIHHQPESWEPVFSVAETDERELADAEDWCIGFLQAASLDPVGWGELFDHPSHGPLLVPVALLGGDPEANGTPLEPAAASRLADPEHRDGLSRAVPDAVLALAGRTRS